jgi:DNA repair protein RadB
MKSDHERTGNGSLDGLLGGGIERRTITQFVGEPATGKTTLCLIIAAEFLRHGHTVVWIDSEGFSVERFRQVAGEDAEALASRLILYEPVDFAQQGSMILEADRVIKAHQATALYRTELDRGRDAMQALTRQMLMLLGYAKRYNIPVLVTNQVYVNTSRNTYVGLGGTALEHLSKAIIRLTKRAGMGERRACLAKHRSLAEGRSVDFEMAEAGIRCLP